MFVLVCLRKWVRSVTDLPSFLFFSFFLVLNVNFPLKECDVYLLGINVLFI